jgi:hypothetical protein
MRRLLWAAVVAAVAAGPADAAIITSGGGYQVGVDATGTLYESGIGFRRPDGYDPIAQGTPRDAWGIIVAGQSAGQVDPNGYVIIANVTSGLAAFTSSGGTTTHTYNPGMGALLRVQHEFSFAADNVLQVAVTVTNVSGGALAAVEYRRVVNLDVAVFTGGSPAADTATANARPLDLVDSSADGFAFADPASSVGSPAFPGTGGTFGPAEVGALFDVGIGPMAAGASTSFNLYYGLNTGPNQTEAALRTQMTGLGASYIISVTGGTAGDVAALGFSGWTMVAPCPAVPAPAGLLLGLLGAGPAAALLRRRRAG